MSSVSSNTWHFWRSLLIAKWHIFPKRPEIPRFQKQHVVSSPDSSHQQLLELQRRQTTKSLLLSETLTTSNWFSTTKTLSHISLIPIVSSQLTCGLQQILRQSLEVGIFKSLCSTTLQVGFQHPLHDRYLGSNLGICIAAGFWGIFRIEVL